MLKRIAANLFWLTRYLERAEWRARLLEVNYRLLVEGPDPAEDGWWPLLAITGEWDLFAEHYAAYDERSVLSFFAFDPNNRSSIATCIEYARENCRATRHRVSSELWLEVNTLYLESKHWSFELMHRRGLLSFVSELRDRFFRIGGVMQSTLPRDSGYDFLSLGRWLESAENVTRLLDAKYHFLLPRPAPDDTPLDYSQWIALLRSASALESYRSAYGNTVGAEQIIDFLLFNPLFPRAARFSVERLEAALGRIQGKAVENAPVMVAAAHTLGGRLREDRAATVMSHGLHDYLLAIKDDCAAIGREIFDAYFKYE
jgi:uncharacterized alpha-E superfamily protein